METGNITKPAATVAPAAPARADHLVAAGAVRTELAPEAAVQQAEEPQAVRFESSPQIERRAALESTLQDFIKRHITVDPRTREVVFQTVDERTGAVVRQLPEEAILKLRAYARELREADSAPDGDHTKRVHKIA
jgi:uncharacterized FlaG/YvyC family protein